MGKKKDETKPDRPAAPLPAITAPKFMPSAESGPEVSVTSPNTAPNIEEPEERTNTQTQLDPSAYTPSADKNPHELSSDFTPASGKQLDAGGRLVARSLASAPDPTPVLASAPVPPPAAAPDVDTETAVPKHRVIPFRKAPEPKVEEPPVQPVAGQRREPGRWVLNREGQFAPETASEVEPGAFDPTVLRAAPSGPPGKIRPPLIGIAAAVAVLLVGVVVWVLRPLPAPDPPQASTAPAPATSDPEPARIRITSKPTGAAVHVNGVSLGVTPVDRASPFAPEAELEVEVLLKGYRPWTRKFHAGQSVDAHAPLKPAR